MMRQFTAMNMKFPVGLSIVGLMFRIGRKWIIRMTAMTSPCRNGRAGGARENRRVALTPEAGHSKYFPRGTTALPKWCFSEERPPPPSPPAPSCRP
jgi:hypothetical protein